VLPLPAAAPPDVSSFFFVQPDRATAMARATTAADLPVVLSLIDELLWVVMGFRTG
jgi:hypothetical protein